eukprot:TRINITY_DN7155_c0_g1_i1.p1 TRINITY_DN7155_c0_g1~~TRINITY_DN7155_c0_g1_i1.p1  ORF type:complete len:856 (+),score=293.05 TRINITY_DN7155_c0_g1_i1:43-2568(+)
MSRPALGSGRAAAGRRDMQRIPTTAPGDTNANARMDAQRRLAARQAQQRAAASRQQGGGARMGARPSGSPAAAGRTTGAAGARTGGARMAGAAGGRAGAGSTGMRGNLTQMRTRRPSQVVIEQEKKTEYWRSLITGLEKIGNFKLDAKTSADVIARSLLLGLVKDKRARIKTGEDQSTPDPRRVLAGLEKHMIARLTELNNGTPVKLDPRTPPLAKIVRMEKAIQVLEARKKKEEEIEAAKVQDKIKELQSSIVHTEQKKEKERETNRRTMKLELANIQEAMQKMQQQQDLSKNSAAASQASAMSAKMNRLEAALRLMNEERKTKVDDKETLLLKRKLALFEQKFKDLESQKTMSKSAQEADGMRDKVLLMEEKLRKMERRKSMSMTQMMQEKMNQVEKQLEMLRNQRGDGAKMAQLESELKKLRNTKITSASVNDDETNALRNHIKKLEAGMMNAEKKMEQQRLRIEQDRMRAMQARQREEQEFRDAARKREQELLKRLQMIEQRVSQPGAGGGGGAPNPDVLKRLRQMEDRVASGGGGGGGNANVEKKMAEMEARLQATQKALEDERTHTKAFLEAAPTEGPALEDWQNKMQIAWLQKANADLMAKLAESTKMMDAKMEQMSKMSFAGGGNVHNSGLSYKEINEKLAEIQKELFDDATPEQRSEQLNIEYEKLITELESTSEYQAEQAALVQKWRDENEPLNTKALRDIRVSLRALGDTGCLNLFKKKPELRMVLNTPEQIMKKHVNDFNALTTQSLNEQEARALYAAMPKFRKDQEKQLRWLSSLKDKIETEANKPKRPPPPPIKAKKRVVLPKVKKSAGGGGGDFLAELLKKRARKD